MYLKFAAFLMPTSYNTWLIVPPPYRPQKVQNATALGHRPFRAKEGVHFLGSPEDVQAQLLKDQVQDETEACWDFVKDCVSKELQISMEVGNISHAGMS